MLSGKILHNCVYKYHFEPWAHHKNLIGEGYENPIISDSIDGADANLTPSNVSLFSIGESLQVHKRVIAFLMRFFSAPTALSLVYWLTFALCFFALFNFLHAWGVPTAINLALSIGFTYGSTNNHFYAYGTLTAFGVTCFWFLERLIQTRKVTWFVLLTLALINLCGAEMIHVVAFYSFSLFAYAIFRLCTVPEKRKETCLLITLSFLFSILMSSDYIYPTAYHYLFNFEKGYREDYGLRQNSPISFVTLFFSRIFGDPILEQRRWPGGTFLTTSLFMGSLTAFSLAALLVPRKWPAKFLSCLLFFIGMAIVATAYQYDLPYENVEELLAAIPPFKWAPPLYFKAVYHFFLIVVAAFSLTSIYGGGLSKPWQKWAALIVMLIPLGVSIEIFYKHYALNGPSVWTDNFFKEAMLFIALTISCLSGIIFGGLHVKRIASFLLVILVTLEARAHTRGWFPQADPNSCYPRTAVTDFLQTQKDGSRIQGLGRAAVPAIISPGTYGLETAAGRMSVSPGLMVLLQQIDPMAYKNHATQYLFSESSPLDHPVWELLNVRFFICRKAFTQAEAHLYNSASLLKFHYLSDGLVIERAANSTPALFRSSWLTARDEADMDSILHNGYDWSSTAIIDVSDEERMKEYDQPPAATDQLARILRYEETQNQLTLEISQPTSGVWILSERWDPLWTVTVDDRTVIPIRAYFSLMSIPVSGGTHTIKMTYGLPGLFFANICAALSTFIFLMLIAFLHVKRREEP
jgi:hypothetical protein